MMIQIPPSVLAAVKLANEQHPGDVAAALAAAEAAVKGLPEYASYVEMLVRHSLMTSLYAVRHQRNVQVKREAKAYSPPAKVTGGGPTVTQVYTSLFSYQIGGRTLGLLKAQDLDALIEEGNAAINGWAFNVRLCSKLKAYVRDDNTVADTVTEQKLRAIWKEAEKGD
jgi:hypothetical protein